MKFRNITLIIFCLIFMESLSANTWKNFSCKAASGFHASYLPAYENRGGGSLVGLGIEYSIPFQSPFFLSVDASWLIYDSMFDGGVVTSSPVFGRFPFPSYFLSFIPIFYFNLGYEIKDDLLVTLGTVYLWGVNFGVRKLISDKWSFDMNWSWFFDRVFFDDGIHDTHILFSIRYLLK